MAVFEAEAINALDFFHLAFGSSSEAPESGGSIRGERVRAIAGNSPSPNGLFFKTSPLCELESLYLNLCFLEEISQLVFPRLSTLRHPDLGLCLENIWISFKNHSSPIPSRVPFLWNFTVDWIGADVEAVMGRDIPRPGEPPFYGIFFMGAVHCAAMMARRHQTPASLAAAVATMIQILDRQRSTPGMPSLAVETENLFRSEVTGGGEEWPEPSQTLHRRAFQLGVDLVSDGLEGRCPSREDFSDSLTQLKSAVWRGLFGAGPPRESLSAGRDDALILEVLTGVLKRWRADQGPPAYPTARDPEKPKSTDSVSGGFDGDEDLARTVVIGPGAGAPPAAPAAELLDTVILGAGGSAAYTSSGEGKAAPHVDSSTSLSDDFPETVVISPGEGGHPKRRAGGTGDSVTPPPPSAEDDNLAETVVVGKAGGPPPPPGRSGEPPGKKPRKDNDEKDDDEAEDDIIFETVIIRPGSLRGNYKEE